jgi:hypothetical protein
MALNPDLPCSLFRRRGGTAVFAAMAICLGIGGQVLAQAPYDNAQTPEGWAWALIKQGKEADFNVRCGTTPALDPRLESESRWTDDCRRLSAAFLVDVLTSELLRKQVPFAGVNIVGARIEGDIELRNAKLDRALFVDQSRIENNISLYAARTDSIISFVRSRVVGTVTAELLHGEVSLLLRDTEFKQAVTLKYARVEGNVDMDGATVGGKLDATALQGGASLFMSPTEQNKSSFKQVTLLRAKIIGQVVMAGATFDGELNANSLHVGDALFMMSTAQNRASFKEVNLVGANVTSNVDMDDATFDGELNADSMQVGASLFMRGATGKKSMDMALARISGSLDMRGRSWLSSICREHLLLGIYVSALSIRRTRPLSGVPRRANRAFCISAIHASPT